MAQAYLTGVVLIFLNSVRTIASHRWASGGEEGTFVDQMLDSLTMDWEMRKDTTTRVQQLFIDLGVITDFKTPVPEDKIVDRSYYQRVVGAIVK